MAAEEPFHLSLLRTARTSGAARQISARVNRPWHDVPPKRAVLVSYRGVTGSYPDSGNDEAFAASQLEPSVTD
jgi:hypothetical protein